MYSTTVGPPYMIRVYQNPESPQILQKFRNEAYVLAKMYKHKEIPSPDLIDSFYGDDNNYAVLIMERIDGIPLHEAWSFLSVADKKALTSDVATILSKLHQLDVEGFGSPQISYSDWADFIRQRLLSGLDKLSQTDFSSRIIQHIKTNLDNWLDQLGEPVSTVIHGDLNSHNILISSPQSSPIISGIIDWEWAFLGDPHYDLVAIESLFYNSADIIEVFDKFYQDDYRSSIWENKKRLYLVDKFVQNAQYHIFTNRFTTQQKHLTEFMLSSVLT